MTTEFQGKVVLITGAASGFGRLLAEKLSGLGAHLVLGDLNQAGLQELAGSLSGDPLCQVCDVSIEAQVQALCGAAAERFGRLDIAVNNAGIATDAKPLLESTEAEFDLNMAVNAKSVFFGMKHQIPIMLGQGGGVILNTASLAGLVADPDIATYVAAKHACVGLTKAAAVEYGAQNIRVNAVCPFYVPTPIMGSDLMDAEIAEFAERVPLKRLATPAEIVDTMCLLISEGNRYMNGQAIPVDGGVMARA